MFQPLAALEGSPTTDGNGVDAQPQGPRLLSGLPRDVRIAVATDVLGPDQG